MLRQIEITTCFTRRNFSEFTRCRSCLVSCQHALARWRTIASARTSCSRQSSYTQLRRFLSESIGAIPAQKGTTATTSIEIITKNRRNGYSGKFREKWGGELSINKLQATREASLLPVFVSRYSSVMDIAAKYVGEAQRRTVSRLRWITSSRFPRAARRSYPISRRYAGTAIGGKASMKCNLPGLT